jgi:hypothetical protein
MKQPTDYVARSDQELDVIFGQHVGGYICDSVAAMPVEVGQCNMYGRQAHYAPDDWNRPQPIGGGGEDFDAALEAARKFFDGMQVDLVLTTNSAHHVYVTRAGKPDDGTGVDPTRQHSGKWDHANERDRWVSVRRSVILCILALADAPLAPTIHAAVAP